MIKPYGNINKISKGEIGRAGDVLKQLYFARDLTDKQDIELDNAVNIINDWRGLHLHPLNTLQSFFRAKLTQLGYKTEDGTIKLGDKEALIGQRPKRNASIVKKLSRIKGKLDSFQDIGGIRIVLHDIQEIENFIKKLKSTKAKHKIIKEYDYIVKPKDDGYRSIHYVYEAISSKAPKELTDLHLKVELQLRTALQHYWATAVESVGMFYGEAIKNGEGSEMWNEFFLCASAAFACMEELPLPEKYENRSREEIKEELKRLNENNAIIYKLNAIKIISENATFFAQCNFASLVFNRTINNQAKIQFISHGRKTDKAAFKAHEKIENESIKNADSKDIVFIKADNKHLKKIFSNYFLEIDDFMKKIMSFMLE